MPEEEIDPAHELPEDSGAPDLPGEPITTDAGLKLHSRPTLPFHVVGIGASAGGIEAYVQLLEKLPATTGMAFVLLLHLSADQESHLPEILSGHTPMPVQVIESGMSVQPDRVYVLPPNADLRIENGVLLLNPLYGQRGRVIDKFFFSLASDQRNRAVGIVLSGMDSDGALGLRAIKGEGGISLVQTPSSARFPEMPRSSISADHVDLVLSPSAIAEQLAQLGHEFRRSSVRLLQGGHPTAGEERYFNLILNLMRGVSGVDFRLYKPPTIRRRIARRMLLHGIDSLRDYLVRLQNDSDELRELQEDALINVTRFFREPEVFDYFKNHILPKIFETLQVGQQIRLWVAGCSSGEEVYSLAICLLEYLTGHAIEPPIQIFGTDASEANIRRARAGFYPESVAADVSPDRLSRYFVRHERGYQVNKRIRDLCIFARQNLCHDPPFSRIDVISCRNVLIYFGAELQRRLIATFHFAMRPGGFLILGTSETIRDFTDLFTLADRRFKVYSRNPGDAVRAMTDSAPRVLLPDPMELPAAPLPQPPDLWSETELQRAVDRILITRYAPPTVVINERMEILQARGRAAPFLELRPGVASLDLFRMMRDSIVQQVRDALRRAMEQDLPVQIEGLQISDGDTLRVTNLEILPVHGLGNRARCYLIVFAHPLTSAPLSYPPGEFAGALSAENRDRLLAQLRNELDSARANLQSLLEERDAKNQELVSANEEIQSANEELQSTNEELATTKEELQSSNEELHTVNDELQNRNTFLTQAGNDLRNLLNSGNLPVLILSNELTIRHFTPPTQRVMTLRASDIGRPFSELRVNLDVADLTPLFLEVVNTLRPREIEVQDHHGHWYALRVHPYRTADNKIEGVIAAFIDIDELHTVRNELRTARDFSRSVIQGVPLPLAVVDAELKISAVNQAFCALTRLQASELDRRYLPSLAGQFWGMEQQMRQQLETLRNSRQVGETVEFDHVTTGERPKTFRVRGCVLQPDHVQFLLVTMEDFTGRRDAESSLKTENERLTRDVSLAAQALDRSQNELRALAKSLFNSQEEERRRIARDLHDDVTQRLAAIAIDADRIQMNVSQQASAEELKSIGRALTSLADDVRTMSHRLHPSILEDLGLKPALRSLTEEFGSRENMIATFSSRNVPDQIPLDVATGLYRTAQEALRNVAKHAGQTHVRVTLLGTRDAIQLQIADFGQGFDLLSERSGLGLLSMEERVRYIGGALEIKSALGEGTRITATVPLEGISDGAKDENSALPL